MNIGWSTGRQWHLYCKHGEVWMKHCMNNKFTINVWIFHNADVVFDEVDASPWIWSVITKLPCDTTWRHGEDWGDHCDRWWSPMIDLDEWYDSRIAWGKSTSFSLKTKLRPRYSHFAIEKLDISIATAETNDNRTFVVHEATGRIHLDDPWRK